MRNDCDIFNDEWMIQILIHTLHREITFADDTIRHIRKHARTYARTNDGLKRDGPQTAVNALLMAVYNAFNLGSIWSAWK